MNVQKKFAFKIIRIQLNLLSHVSKSLTGKRGFRLFTTPVTLPATRRNSSFDTHIPVSFRWKHLTIRGFRCNPGAAKRALILHGFSSTLHVFDHFIEPLIATGYEVLAFDAPAHGNSDGKRAHALDYAQMIGEIQYQFGPIHAYIAHSFGGLGLALALEDKPVLKGTRVVLIAPATETTTAIKSGLQMLGVHNSIVEKALENEIFSVSGKPASWFSVRRAIRYTNAEVLWVHDEQDDITPYADVQPLMQEAHPHIDFYITQGLGHRKVYKNTLVVERIIRFLQ